MLNFKACGTPLNIMQSSKYFAQNFFIMIGTTSKGGTVKLVTFIFPPLAKGHPNIYICIFNFTEYISYTIKRRVYVFVCLLVCSLCRVKNTRVIIHATSLKAGLKC